MPITLQTARRQSHDDDRTLEKSSIHQTILAFRGSVSVFGYRCNAAGEGRCTSRAITEDTNPIEFLESSDLLRCIEPIHHRQLNVHEHQMETASSPLVDRFSPIHRRMPSYLQTLHESLEKLQIDDVVFDDKNINRWHCSI